MSRRKRRKEKRRVNRMNTRKRKNEDGRQRKDVRPDRPTKKALDKEEGQEVRVTAEFLILLSFFCLFFFAEETYRHARREV